MTQKITPYLWYDGVAEEAANHYVSIFPDGKIIQVDRVPEGAPLPAGTVLTVTFELAGQRFVALNGGPAFNFTEAMSLFVECADQSEVDRYWTALTEGGSESQCGWLKDRYGVSWQIIPRQLSELMNDPDPVKSARVMQAMLGMSKIEVQALRDAYDGAA
jgi:predicted 3-demethylubiquinone-9 3-methyltransferase (glyoxalase superfamily)